MVRERERVAGRWAGVHEAAEDLGGGCQADGCPRAAAAGNLQ